MAPLLLLKTLSVNQLRTLCRSTVAFSVPLTSNMCQNRQKFNEVLPEVMDCLMTSPKFTNQLPEVGSWVKQLLNYTIIGGKQSRGLGVPFAYQKMEDPKYFNEEKLHRARFLGWCLEIVHPYLPVTDRQKFLGIELTSDLNFGLTIETKALTGAKKLGILHRGCILAVDDIIDASTTRRGKPCWYLQPNVGSSAINDCFLIYHCFFEILEIKFGTEPFYSDLIKIINETLMYTTMGQYLDISLAYTKEKNNLDGFTMERFNAIAVQKTGYYSFRLPMLSGLLLVKNWKERDTTELCNICLEFGKLLQFQNDYKDIWWDEASSGKEGTDIQEGKLSWIAVAALERCNEAQRSIFKQYYGSKDPEHVKRIRQLYDDVQIVKVYEKFTNSFYESLERRIRALPTVGETEFFLEIMDASQKHIY